MLEEGYLIQFACILQISLQGFSSNETPGKGIYSYSKAASSKDTSRQTWASTGLCTLAALRHVRKPEFIHSYSGLP